MSAQKFPLAVHFIWHPDEKEIPEQILEYLQNILFKKKTNEFSGCNEIPFFFYSSLSNSEIPNDLELVWAEKNIVFIFSGIKLVISDKWNIFLNSIKRTESVDVIPISIDSKGLKLPGHLAEINAIRLEDFSDNKIEYGTMCICHAIQRFMTQDRSSLKIFLSHCKVDSFAVSLVQILQTFIKTKTGISAFFDATEIRQGFVFEHEINGNLDNSSILALCTDSYSSRYWCQHEIQYAKRKQKPILLVDAIKNNTDRFLPTLGNLPCVRLNPECTPQNDDILKLLTTILVETVRCNYAKILFEFYSNHDWIKKDSVTFLLRPPETSDLPCLDEHKKEICYPEPHVYSGEIDWLKKIGLKSIPFYGEIAINPELKVGISISDFNRDDNYKKNHIPERILDCFAHNLARQLVQKNIQIIYGGDFRKNGFTEAILDEIKILASDESQSQYKEYKLLDYLAWPIYNKMDGNEEWYADNKAHLTRENIPPEDVPQEKENSFVAPNTVENKLLWSINLTKMRSDSIAYSDARICAGGRLFGYKGKMPGVLEEILIAIQSKKPVYLIGAFGGVVGKVCQTILSGKIAEELTEDWQCKNNDGYADLQDLAKDKGINADYVKIESDLKGFEIDDMAKKSGLTKDEYQQLMQTPSIDEAIRLILLGLSKIGGGNV